MSDLIKRTDVVKAILSKPAWHSSDGSYYHSSDIKDAINNLPSTERAKGKWESLSEYDNNVIECSECGHRGYFFMKTNYCPNCGVDMRGESE